ncbi:hypothetical protein C8R43DRAFT_1136254 [Mycena crocata]|nr:hypothetical protein C8R43DRAFT_1136254 [Mycena crocata]
MMRTHLSSFPLPPIIFMVTPLLIPTADDAIRDPIKWNSDWENVLRKNFAMFPEGPTRCFDFHISDILSVEGRQDIAMSGLQTLVLQTCGGQLYLSIEALSYFTSHNFEARWMAASADERGKHILRGMAAVCSKASNLNEARILCAPELRLSRLRLDGKVFLNLLKSLMLEDVSDLPSTPGVLSHPGWDAWAEDRRRRNTTDIQKLVLERMLLFRTKLMCHVSHCILCSFLELDLPKFQLKKEHRRQSGKEPADPLVQAIMQANLGRRGAKTRAKEIKDGAKARIGQGLNVCSNLECFNTETADGSKKFSRCKSCWDKMCRQVLYCSGPCQKADWRQHHKAACGKPLDFETASKPVDLDANAHRIGLPVNGYKRSLPLVSQVSELNTHNITGYRLYNDAHSAYVDINFGPESPLQEVFRSCRELAMTAGDRLSIAKMAHFLCVVATLQPAGITPTTIVKQLAREFTFDGLGAAVLEMQQLQIRDPFGRPPLLTRTPPDAWTELFNETLFTLD